MFQSISDGLILARYRAKKTTVSTAQSFVHTEQAYFSLLSVQGQFGIIQCISSFDDLVSNLNIQGSFVLRSSHLAKYVDLATDQAERQGPWASC